MNSLPNEKLNSDNKIKRFIRNRTRTAEAGSSHFARNVTSDSE